MSETSESYEDLVKQLKPLSVIAHKISDEQFAKLKVVDDPNRIKDEPIAPQVCDISIDEEVVEEEEIEIDLIETEANLKADAENDSNDIRQYSCFFCKQTLIGYKRAFIHYQLHIDYFPIQCSVCDEAITDLLSLVKHCRELHSELIKVKYIRKSNAVYSDWLETYLTLGPNRTFADKPFKYCPVCDWMHLIGVAEESKGPIKSLPILNHIHQHIHYMPFCCKRCEDFRIYCLDSITRTHITSQHSQLEPPYWTHFSKRYSIPGLDKFIANYLGILGIKLPKKRRTRNKPKTKIALTVGQTSHSITLNNSSISNQIQLIRPNVHQLVSTPMSTAVQTVPRTFAPNAVISQTFLLNPISDNLLFPQNFVSQTQNILSIENPLLLLPSSDKINKKGITVESTDLGIIAMDPAMLEIDDKQFKYDCVFCKDDKTYQSKIELCVHYSIHFGYYPVICMLCEKSFLDFSTLICHYNKEHNEYKNNLFHYLKENDKIEKWINRFVDYQRTYEYRNQVSVTYGDYCFVCQKLAKNETPFHMKIETKNMDKIRDHINHHLHYFPFKCLVCFHGNREVRFATVNDSAITHIQRVHNLNHNPGIAGNKSLDFYSKLFIKSDEILDLEKFIDSQLSPRKETTIETELTINLKRKLEEIETENKKRSEISRQFTSIIPPALPSAQVLPIIRETTTIATTITNNLSNNSMTYNRSPMKLGTELIKILKSPQKPMNGLPNRVVPTPAPQPITSTEYIPDRSSYIQPFLLCFHCHQKVSNTKELESHHMGKHPKLTIASYAPTKRDVIGFS